MTEHHAGGATKEPGDQPIAADMRVRVYPGTDAQCHGIVVDDYGDTAGHAVDIGHNHVADPARRWAVVLDSGALLFTDSNHLVAE